MSIPADIILAATQAILGEAENETLRNNPEQAIALAKRILFSANIQHNLVTEDFSTELSTNEIWFTQLKKRFNKLPQLHEGIKWSTVKNSLLANNESMKKLQILDAKGQKMNVCGEENGKLIFISTWNNYDNLSEDHKNLLFDSAAETAFYRSGDSVHRPKELHKNLNARTIIDTLGVELAESKHHEILRRVLPINGFAWLKSEVENTKNSKQPYANAGNGLGIFKIETSAIGPFFNKYQISFRALISVAKI